MNKFAIAVKAFIVSGDKVLLLKRRPDDVQKPGQWDIPGGRLEPAEDPFLGIKRETKEETNLAIEPRQPLSIRHFTRDDGQVITMIVFLCEPLTTAVLLSEEHTDYQWVKIEEAATILGDWLRTIVSDYQDLHKPARERIHNSTL